MAVARGRPIAVIVVARSDTARARSQLVSVVEPNRKAALPGSVCARQWTSSGSRHMVIGRSRNSAHPLSR